MKNKNHTPSYHLFIVMFITILGSAFLANLLITSVQAGGTIFVDADSACNSSCGGTWATAYPYLQDALVAAQDGDQVWVAEGVYYPDEGSGQTNNARTATFPLVDGVAVYGGFTGTETSLAQRSNPAPATVLSGDVEKNDIVDASGVVTDTADIVGDNAFHVVTGSGLGETAVLDHLIITAGQATGTVPEHQGGGMMNDNANPTLTHIKFSGNMANGNGGGVFNNNSSPLLTNVTFYNNRSVNGNGGGMYNATNSNPALTDVIFNGNRASSFGGGMGNSSSNPILLEVIFQENSANGSGGGMMNTASTPSLTAVTFISNTATINGGGMHNTSGSNLTLTDVTFIGNEANYGGGMSNSTSNPQLTNVTFNDNSGATYGSGMYNNYSSPIVTEVTFVGNQDTTQGGGMYNTNSSPVLTNVTFNNNSADSYGGGIRNHNNSHPTLTNVTFSANHADSYGGGMFNVSSSPVLTNVTFSANSAGFGGGGLYNFSGSSTLTNVIIANSADGGDCGNNADGSIASGSSYNLIEDSGSNACDLPNGVDNNIIGQDPLLGALQDNGGDTLTHALLPGSPAIDAGDNAACPAEDQRGRARLQLGDLQCDIGAYERDTFPPQIVSIIRVDANPNESLIVDFVVTFSEDVVGLDSIDFNTTTTGTLNGSAISNITGSGAVYTVTVDAGTGGGSLRLDMPNSATVTDLSANALVDVPYTSGETYTILGIKVYLPLVVD